MGAGANTNPYAGTSTKDLKAKYWKSKEVNGVKKWAIKGYGDKYGYHKKAWWDRVLGGLSGKNN